MLHKLKLNWHSPVPESRTDIAHYTARLAPALSQVANVTFWTSQPKIDPAFASRYRVRTLHADGLRRPGLYQELLEGVNVYNIGNNADFHKHIFSTSLQIPGVVILHDSIVHHLIFEMSREDRPKWARYLAWARRLYGEEGYTNAQQVANRRGEGIDEVIHAMPFTQAALINAIGVVCHSEQAAQDISKECPSIAKIILPLPFAPTVEVSTAPVPGFTKRLVMFGYISKNRRLEQVLRALAAFEQRDRVHLDIIGMLWDDAEVTTLIQELGLTNVQVHGYVSELKLEEILHQADIAFNLRWPTVGEASGGILRSWHAKLPSVVTDAGWYADLPDDIVIKTTVQTETEDIHRILTTLLEAPGSLKEIGARAHAYFKAHHACDQYAQRLVLALGNLRACAADLCARVTLERLLSQASPTYAEREAYASRAIHHLTQLYDAD